ncbi:MAG TPA: hypothetical protein VFP84_36510 [Kofleriaceae bacterium]|nr:hypothetical protein [Kofleriaceae bacterium]
MQGVLACGAIAALVPACGELVDPSAEPATQRAEQAVIQPRSTCTTATAGGGFVSIAIPDATVLDVVDFTVTVDTVGLDAVVALSAGVPINFNSLATAVRFNAAGNIDVRNGAAYQADFVQPYTAGASFSFRTIADATSHTYSTLLANASNGASELARQYGFRTTALVNHLDHLSAEVDGASGSMTVCFTVTPSSNAAYSREGTYSVVPLASNTAVISDGVTSTQKLSATGKTTASVARGGELAVDAAGNVAIASVAGTTLTVSSVTSAFAARWTATQSVADGSRVAAVSTDAAGTTRVGLVNGSGTITVASVSSTGAVGAALALAGDSLRFDGDQPIVWANTGTTLGITKYTATGGVVWADAFPGSASIESMAVDPAHNVVFGGELLAPTDFGGGVLQTHTTENGPVNAFVVRLSAAGAFGFAAQLGTREVRGVAANASAILVSHTSQASPRFPRLTVLDAAGSALSTTFGAGLGDFGQGLRVAVNSTGRAWWNVQSDFPVRTPFPFLVVLTP